MGEISLEIYTSVILAEDSFMLLMNLNYAARTAYLHNVTEKQRIEIPRLLNQINYRLIAGNFEMPEKSGEITYRQLVSHNGMVVSDDIVRFSISYGLEVIQKYGNVIARFALDTCSIAEAMQMAQDA